MNLPIQEILIKLYLKVPREYVGSQEKGFHIDDAVDHGFDKFFFLFFSSLSGDKGNIWAFT